MPKRYDQSYFDRWYRSARRVHSPAEVRRKVSLAVAVAEYLLHRPLRSVLDIGCGEGAWLPHLRELRPNVDYAGIDPSDYVIRRFGKKRNIRRGSFGELPSLGIEGTFDLIICADFLHYLTGDEISTGIREVARLLAGVAYIELLTKEDGDIVGDVHEIKLRPAAWYRKLFAEVGLMGVAPFCFAAPALLSTASALEMPE